VTKLLPLDMFGAVNETRTRHPSGAEMSQAQGSIPVGRNPGKKPPSASMMGSARINPEGSVSSKSCPRTHAWRRRAGTDTQSAPPPPASALFPTIVESAKAAEEPPAPVITSLAAPHKGAELLVNELPVTARAEDPPVPSKRRAPPVPPAWRGWTEERAEKGRSEWVPSARVLSPTQANI
jgi:hypothetical protein